MAVLLSLLAFGCLWAAATGTASLWQRAEGGWCARASPLIRNSKSPVRQSALEIHVGVRHVRVLGVRSHAQ
eukprot:590231-Alexandrium_andersonii.AAC.1